MTERRSSLVLVTVGSAVLAALSAVAACRRSVSEESVAAAPTAAHLPASPSATLASSPGSADAAPESSAAARTLPDVASDWCLEGWRGLDDATCYFLPDDAASPAILLVYLSGIVPPTPRSPQKEKVQRIVAAASRRANAAVLLPRGRRGIGPTDATDWWAWPTSAKDYATHAASMVSSWLAARSAFEAVLGRRFERTYLAGSSSGAYFLSALALNGAIDVDGFAATSGGAAGFAGVRPDASPRPFYVGYATGDPTSGAPKALAAFLAARGWPVKEVPHPGGHGAREEYLDEAFAFWQARLP